MTYIEAIASGTDIVARLNEYTETLTQNGSFGMTFSDDSQIAETVYSYFTQNKKNQWIKKERTSLLNSISSELFGEKVLQFYRETIQQYMHEKEVAVHSNH